MRILLSVLTLAALTTPAFADEVKGTVIAYDRVEHVIVLDDKTVWQIPADFILPEDLVAGDAITIEFEGAAENGIGDLLSITRDGA
jgi:hypothetical protein